MHSLHGNLSQDRWEELNSNNEIVQSKWGLGKGFTRQNQSGNEGSFSAFLFRAQVSIRGSGKGY